MQAGAPELVCCLNEGGLQTELSGADGTGIPRRSSADNCNVINGFCQGMLRSKSGIGCAGAQNSAELLILCESKRFMRVQGGLSRLPARPLRPSLRGRGTLAGSLQ